MAKISNTHHVTKNGTVKKNPRKKKDLKNVYGVVRVEAIDEDDFDMQDVAESFELGPYTDRAEAYMEMLRKKGLLVGSMYVGNAYYFDAKGSDTLDTFARLVREDTKGKLPKGTKISVEEGYVPEWADDDEEDDW